MEILFVSFILLSMLFTCMAGLYLMAAFRTWKDIYADIALEFIAASVMMIMAAFLSGIFSLIF